MAMACRMIGTTLLASGLPVAGVHALAQAPSYTVLMARTLDTRERQATRVTLEARGVSVQDALDQIAAQARLALMWDHAKIPLNQKISVSLKDATVPEALTAVLRGTGAEGRLSSDGQTILVVRVKESGRTVIGGMIAGRVTDSASGQGLGGAAVKVEGTKLSTVTSDSGHFTLRDVPVGDQVISVKLFGYKAAERSVAVVDSQRTTVRIALASVPTVLSGVVTTATGLRRRVEIGNDITTINVDSVMKTAPIMTMTDLLETRVPGLTVLHSSGAPGDPSRIRLRGASSIYGNNDPIIIVDGIRMYSNQSDPRNDNLAPSAIGRVGVVRGSGTGAVVDSSRHGYAAPSPLDQIDPNSIETIEVFKGPSASSLYGSDAANGVIVITTKHGRAGPTHWTVALGAGFNQEPGSWPVNYYRFGTGAGSTPGSWFCVWSDPSCVQDSIVGFQALNDPRYTVFANHGSDQQYSATVSGGVQTLQYSLTATGTNDVGLLKLPGIEVQRYEKFYSQSPPSWMLRPQNYGTWGGNGQVTAHPTPALNVTLSSSLLDANQQKSSLESAINQLDGVYIDPLLLGNNPLVSQFVERVTDHAVTSTNAVTLDWRAASWLPITATGGINTIQRTDESLIPYGINQVSDPNGVCLGQCASDTTGSFGLGRGVSQVNTVSIRTSIPAWHQQVTVTVGGDLTSTSTNDVTAYTSQLAPGVTSPSSFPTTGGVGGMSPSTFSQSTTAGSTYGLYLQTNVHLFGSMYLNPGFRLDGGSASGANGSSGAAGLQGLTGLPKIDLSYLLIDQSKPRGALTLLRPRLSFGRAQTDPGPTEKLRLLNADTVTTLDGGNSLTSNITLQTLGNTQLQPETSSEVDGGFDAELWHGRLTLTWTQYNKTRHNAIINVPVAPSISGGILPSPFINVGEIRNTGHEVTWTAQLLQRRALGWYVGGNFSNDKNVVVRLNKGTSTIDFGNGVRVEAGYPLFSQWAVPITSFQDVNHDGIIEGSEVRYGDSAVFVGEGTPKYQLNLNSGVTLLNGRLSVNASIAYTNGVTQSDVGGIQAGAFALLPNAPGSTQATQAIVVAATGGGLCPSIQGGGILICPPVTTLGAIQTVNTLRFSNLSIAYTMPSALSQLFRVPRMEVALQGSNLGLHSNYRGKDPDVNLFSTVSSGDQSQDVGQIPEPRTWWLRVTLGN